jgi:hypothetical protein
MSSTSGQRLPAFSKFSCQNCTWSQRREAAARNLSQRISASLRGNEVTWLAENSKGSSSSLRGRRNYCLENYGVHPFRAPNCPLN